MTTVKKNLSALVLCGACTVAGAGIYQLLRSPARAADPVETPAPVVDVGHAAQSLSNSFHEVDRAVSPAVVNINVRKTVKAAGGGMREQLRRFFPDGQIPQDLLPPDGGQDQQEAGTGSGVLMEVDGRTGYILTNNHVAGDADQIQVTLADGRKIDDGKLVGADPKSDLAVVKIQLDNLPSPAHWGDSGKLQKGDWILAFGSPFGYVGSMTHGIVSALDRSNVGMPNQTMYENFIQVDAPINPGNSGGPLVDLSGQVVGINTAIASQSGGSEGIGFAIPSNQAKFVYEQLKAHGKVTRGWLGVSIADVSENLNEAQSFGYKHDTGVLVEETFPNTPAHGKLQPGDIIVGLDARDIASVEQLRNAIATTLPNADVTLKVFRDGKNQDVTIKIGEQPEDLASATGHPREETPGHDQGETAVAALGMKLTTLTDDLAQKYGLQNNNAGALITAVEPNSAAGRAGLRPGDLILRVNRAAVSTAKEAGDLLAKADLATGVRMYIANREGSRFVFIRDAH